jgi:hypothetical protein
MGSPTERARVNIARAIKLALRKIMEHHPALSQHLATTIKTGTYCSYIPDVRLPITWVGWPRKTEEGGDHLVFSLFSPLSSHSSTPSVHPLFPIRSVSLVEQLFRLSPRAAWGPARGGEQLFHHLLRLSWQTQCTATENGSKTEERSGKLANQQSSNQPLNGCELTAPSKENRIMRHFMNLWAGMCHTNYNRRIVSSLLALLLLLGTVPAWATSYYGEWSVSRSNTGGQSFVTMSPSSYTFCYLSRVGMADTDSAGEWATCTLLKGYDYWFLSANLARNDDADVQCAAICYYN